MSTQTTIPLADIQVDASLQPRVSGLDEQHVQALMEAPEAWPAVVVVPRDGRYMLVDGFHRLAAAQNLGLGTITVTVMEMPEDGDLARLAFAANLAHGLPLTLADKRARTERLLREHPAVSNMEIARQVALSPTTVAAIRQRLEEAATIAPIAQRVGAGGYRYTVGTTPKQRLPGELPAAGLDEQMGNAVGRLFTPAERIQQRRVVQYLQRLVVALDEQYDLDGWESADEAAEACRLVLGEERAAELAGQLGSTSGAICDVARALGYHDAGDQP